MIITDDGCWCVCIFFLLFPQNYILIKLNLLKYKSRKVKLNKKMNLKWQLKLKPETRKINLKEEEEEETAVVRQNWVLLALFYKNREQSAIVYIVT